MEAFIFIPGIENLWDLDVRSSGSILMAHIRFSFLKVTYLNLQQVHLGTDWHISPDMLCYF